MTFTYTPGATFVVSGIAQDFRGANNYRANVSCDPMAHGRRRARSPTGSTGPAWSRRPIRASRSATPKRNTVRGPKFWQIDLAASKRFALGGPAQFEFRLEAFNLLNHTNFRAPSGVRSAGRVRHHHLHLRSAAAAARVQAAVVARGLMLLVLTARPQASAAAPPRPIIIGHRGASGHRPEHTLASYRLAAEMGADFIEPDLVSTKDGVLIARHENEIGGTTDVADAVSRSQDDQDDRRPVDHRLVHRRLHARRDQDAAREGTAGVPLARLRRPFEVPTFDEVLELAQQLGRELGRPIGVYPETKHPTYFRGIGLPLEEQLLASLEKHGWNRRESPVFIQSFERATCARCARRRRSGSCSWSARAATLDGAGLKDIATYADGLGPEKRLIVPVGADGSLGTPTDLVARAHAAGLLVHVWTLRIDKEFLPAGYKGRPEAEFEQFRELGVDGVFTDFPDVAAKSYGLARE